MGSGPGFRIGVQGRSGFKVRAQGFGLSSGSGFRFRVGFELEGFGFRSQG